MSLTAISRRAGVSVATASRVLNGSSHPVSEATRQRVLAVAEELGYSASALAQALVSKRAKIIGVIVESNVDPYFAEITAGVEEVGHRAGYLTIVCNAARDVEIEVAQLKLLRDYRAAGVVFAGAGFADRDDAGLARLAASCQDDGMKIVALATRDFVADVITYDNRAAAFDLTSYLLSLGHRRVVLVEGLPDVYASVERREGYEAAMSAAGVAQETLTGRFDPESGSAAALRLLATGSLPDAIIGSNDMTAIGVMTALRHAGIGVPADVSVAGIGGTRLSQLLELTTAGAPLHDLGALAARRVIDSEPGMDTAEPVVLPHHVVPRATTAEIRSRTGAADTERSRG